ncbi:MAG: TIGR03960 family B12-binding radical SAM protein [Planctomycetota bacterium]
MSLRHILEKKILPTVQMPGRYIGCEQGTLVKNHDDARLRVALAFADLYDIGMSCQAVQLIYQLINGRDEWLCERVFLPWPDMIDRLREHDVPLYTLESFTPVNEFDVLAVTLQYEMGYTGLLELMDLGGVPVHSEARTDEHPVVLAGGPGASSPEVLAPFVDAFLVGDSEVVLPGALEVLERTKGQPREQRLLELARSSGHVYVPSLYQPGPDGVSPSIEGVPHTIVSGYLADLDRAPAPTDPIVPYIQTVHHRLAIEVMRGCPNHCRFCQSAKLKWPLRIRSADEIVRIAKAGYETTGYHEITLLGLSVANYPKLPELLTRLREYFDPLSVNISVPSLRVDEVLKDLPEQLGTVRKSGLTYAPEAARQTLRDVIRKDITDENLFDGIRSAFSQGWDLVKLYFMVGLPGETDGDIEAIPELAERVSRLKKEMGRKGAAKVNLSVANFIPKPHTPFERLGMATADYLHEARERVYTTCRNRKVNISVHNLQRSLIEAMLCRGDRRVAKVVEAAWRRGSRLDSWDEFFETDRWNEACHEVGLTIEEVACRRYGADETVPWQHISVPGMAACQEAPTPEVNLRHDETGWTTRV